MIGKCAEMGNRETRFYRCRNICFLRCVVLKKTVVISSEGDLFAACVFGDGFGPF